MPIWGPEPTWPPASPVWPGSRREGELTEGMRFFGAVDRMLQAEQRCLRLPTSRFVATTLPQYARASDSQAFDRVFREAQAA